MIASHQHGILIQNQNKTRSIRESTKNILQTPGRIISRNIRNEIDQLLLSKKLNTKSKPQVQKLQTTGYILQDLSPNQIWRKTRLQIKDPETQPLDFKKTDLIRKLVNKEYFLIYFIVRSIYIHHEFLKISQSRTRSIGIRCSCTPRANTVGWPSRVTAL